MPSKIQLDENLWFLYICLQKSDLKTIDFNAVGHATSLKPPAARMRYTRLRRQIESGTLIGTHGTPFASSSASEKIADRTSKRKRRGWKEKTEKSSEVKKRDDGEQKGDEVAAEGYVDLDEQGIEKVVEIQTKIKKEKESDGYESDGDSDETESWFSEDEIPLAKLRKAKRLVSPRDTVFDEDARLRMERERAPVRELSQAAQPQSQNQPHAQQTYLDEMKVQHYEHAPDIAYRETNMFLPTSSLRMCNPYTHHQISTSLLPFENGFGPSISSPYVSEWRQFNGRPTEWSYCSEPLQALSEWEAKKSA